MYAAAKDLGLNSFRQIRRYIVQNFLINPRTKKGNFFFDAEYDTLYKIQKRKKT